MKSTMRYILGLLCCNILVSLFLWNFNAFANYDERYKEGEVIVKYRKGSVRSRLATHEMYNRIGVIEAQRFSEKLKNLEHLMFDAEKLSVEEAIEELEQNPDVEYAQPNYILYSFSRADEKIAENNSPRDGICDLFPQLPTCKGKSPNKPKPSRPAVKPAPAKAPIGPDPYFDRLYGMKKIQVEKAWEIETGSKDIVVAIIDTGVDYNHPDLAYNIWRNPKAQRYAETGVDPFGSEISGDLVGWDFVNNDNLPYDDQSHGTHCAGVVGAVGKNSIGISGVNQEVSLMAIKFLTKKGKGTTEDAIRSIDYARSRGAHIISASWGAPARKEYHEKNKALKEAIQKTADAGMLFVAASGNSSKNLDDLPFLPVSFDVENIIAVSATTSQDTLAVYSNYSPTKVDVAAPGSGILSTIPQGRYRSQSGTSMAAPHVAGLAALIWAHFPEATSDQVKARIMESSDKLNSLQGKVFSGNRINAARALQGEM